MKTLIRLLGAFILVVMLALPASAVICTQGDEDWVVYMTVNTDPDIGGVPGEGAHFGFGAKDGASDEYDSVEGDEIGPPDPVYGINAYFYYLSNPPYQDKLIVSVTGPSALITWPLVVKTVGETGDAQITMSWPDIGSVPPKYTVLELQDTEGATLADMRSVDHYTFSASEGETYSFQIKAEAEETPGYDLTIDSTDGGEVITPGEGTFTYDEGEVIDLIADPDEDYRFVSWTGDVDTIDAVNDAETTITMNGDYAISAEFEEVSSPIPLYTLTIDSTDGGKVTTPGEGVFTYDEGTTVNLMAETGEGHRFVRWTGDVDTIANVNAASTTITMQGDYTVRANFAAPPIQYILTISSTNGGSVTEPGQGAFTYDEGTIVNLMAAFEDGYGFVNWTGDTATIADIEAASTNITMEGDHIITANFEEMSPLPLLYTLAINSTAGSSVTIPGEGKFQYDNGTVVNITAEAEEGYRFVSWTGDVDTVADVKAASTSITMQGEYTITANFDEIAPVNWALVGGIIAVVVVGVALTVFVRKRGPGAEPV